MPKFSCFAPNTCNEIRRALFYGRVCDHVLAGKIIDCLIECSDGDARFAKQKLGIDATDMLLLWTGGLEQFDIINVLSQYSVSRSTSASDTMDLSFPTVAIAQSVSEGIRLRCLEFMSTAMDILMLAGVTGTQLLLLDESHELSSVSIGPEHLARKSERELCAICWEEAPIDWTFRQCPHGHYFHSECLLRWFVQVPVPSCPNCRLEMPQYRQFFEVMPDMVRAWGVLADAHSKLQSEWSEIQTGEVTIHSTLSNHI